MAEWLAKGTIITIGSAVTQVVSCDGPQQSRTMIEGKHLGSDRVRKYPGIKDPGTVTLELLYDPTLHADIKDAYDSGELQEDCTAEYTDGSLDTFDCYVSEFGTSASSVDDLLTATVVLTLDSDVVTTLVDNEV